MPNIICLLFSWLYFGWNESERKEKLFRDLKMQIAKKEKAKKESNNGPWVNTLILLLLISVIQADFIDGCIS